MSENSSVREEIALIASATMGETLERCFSKVASRVPTVSYRTVRALWHGEISDPDHWAARDIRRAAGLIKAKREAQDHAANIRISIERLRRNDQDFFSGEIDRLERALDRISNLDRT